MGKKIDRIAGSALLAVGLYLFYIAAFRSIWLAIVCALASVFLIRRAFSGLVGRLPKREKLRARARSTLAGWARLDAESLRAQAAELLEKAYPGQAEGAQIAALARHPDGAPLSVDALLDAWRGKTCARLIVVSTVAAEPAALAYAATLKAPDVRLIDGAQLTELLARHPQPAETAQPHQRRARKWPLGRDRAPRQLLFGLLLLGMYLLIGNALYLGAALLSLLFAGLGLRKPPTPNRLFE